MATKSKVRGVIYRISDELFADWFELETTKRKKEETEKLMTTLKNSFDLAVETNTTEIATWDAQITKLKEEKAAFLAKADRIQDKLGEAEVGINGSNAL